jgi:vacuolar-type H+-ATPase subunit H
MDDQTLLAEVQAEIKAVEAKLEAVEAKLEVVEAAIVHAREMQDEGEVAAQRRKEEYLHKKEEQLREEKLLLLKCQPGAWLSHVVGCGVRHVLSAELCV